MYTPLDEQHRYAHWLNTAVGAEVKRYDRLVAFFGSPREVFLRAQDGGDMQGLVSGAVKSKLVQSANETEVDALEEELRAKDIGLVLREDADYPELLREIYDPPSMLYVRGKLQNAALPIAVIGARNCTQYGYEVAHSLSKSLAQAGVCVVSGLAYGLDAAAARGALESESAYPTIAVLGCGVDIVYPQTHRGLYLKIIERGAVVSEYLPGAQPKPHMFPKRNRIISGISKGTLVVEAGERSGSSITVRCALEQGRDVFAVPGRIGDKSSEGTNGYIRDGYAKLVMSHTDILSEYGIEGAEDKKKLDIAAMPPEQLRVYTALLEGEKSFDELCELTDISVTVLNSTLTVMEFSGIINQASGRVYSISRL
jgi:DNA processing protein